MSKEVLDRHWQEIMARENVLNVAVGEKYKDGKATGVKAIVVYVSKKVPMVALAAEHLIPPEIEGVPTDVVELAPKTWQAGKTAISQIHPEDQIRRLGANVNPSPKVLTALGRYLKAPSGQSDLTAWANDIQDQMNCGSCLAFDYTGVWEAKIVIVANNRAARVKLSEAHVFFCTKNASCESGSSPEDMIVPCMAGVADEAHYPYKDVDQACGSGLLPNWWLTAKKLAGQSAVTDPNEKLSLLDGEPLVATFQVPQSFFNYQGGIYTSLGDQDPIVGGHGVGCFGYATGLRIMRNQWGIAWGQNCVINGVQRPGWFMIDPNLLDPVMYQLVLSNDPVPAPPNPNPPAPRKCRIPFLHQQARAAAGLNK